MAQTTLLRALLTPIAHARKKQIQWLTRRSPEVEGSLRVGTGRLVRLEITHCTRASRLDVRYLSWPLTSLLGSLAAALRS